MTDLDRIAQIEERLSKATAGPWSVEECGEKGDGSYMVGVVFAMEGDPNCERPLSGWLEPYDDLGNEIEYYRDQLVADCDFHNSNPGADALLIAHSPADLAWATSRLRAAMKVVEAARQFYNEDIPSGPGNENFYMARGVLGNALSAFRTEAETTGERGGE